MTDVDRLRTLAQAALDYEIEEQRAKELYGDGPRRQKLWILTPADRFRKEATPAAVLSLLNQLDETRRSRADWMGRAQHWLRRFVDRGIELDEAIRLGQALADAVYAYLEEVSLGDFFHHERVDAALDALKEHQERGG